MRKGQRKVYTQLIDIGSPDIFSICSLVGFFKFIDAKMVEKMLPVQ